MTTHNEKSIEVYGIMSKQREKSLAVLEDLKRQQQEIDAKIEDHNRVLLALDRMLDALAPVVEERLAAAVEHDLMDNLSGTAESPTTRVQRIYNGGRD